MIVLNEELLLCGDSFPDKDWEATVLISSELADKVSVLRSWAYKLSLWGVLEDVFVCVCVHAWVFFWCVCVCMCIV